MRITHAKAASFALIAPLAGSLLFAAAPASAAPVAAATSVTAKAVSAKADDPYSVFSVKVKAPKTVKRGGKITYRISVYNNGPHLADNYYLGGKLPKGIVNKVYFDGPEGVQCDFYSDGFWCWTPYVLEKGESDWLTIEVKLKKGTKGIAKAKVGAEVWDVPTGMGDLNKEEISRLGGVTGWDYTKNVKTRIR